MTFKFLELPSNGLSKFFKSKKQVPGYFPEEVHQCLIDAELKQHETKATTNATTEEEKMGGLMSPSASTTGWLNPLQNSPLSNRKYYYPHIPTYSQPPISPTRYIPTRYDVGILHLNQVTGLFQLYPGKEVSQSTPDEYFRDTYYGAGYGEWQCPSTGKYHVLFYRPGLRHEVEHFDLEVARELMDKYVMIHAEYQMSKIEG